MRLSSGVAAIALSIFGLGGLVAQAQERPTWGPAVGFPNGTFIQTGIGTVPAGELELKVLNTEVVTGSANAQGLGVFRRILRLRDGRAIVYEIAVTRRADSKDFEVTLGSWIPTAAEAREMEIDPARMEANFLGKYPHPIMVSDGDLLAVDLLQNPRTGVKLVDYFRFSGRRPRYGDNSPKPAVVTRNLGIEDIEFMVENFDLRLNGKEIYASKGGIGGRFLWIDIPQTGRFILSLTPLSEADGFHREAFLTQQQIGFNHGSDTYLLTSERPIVTASGTFNLWIRLDPTFTFPTRWPDQAGNSFSVGAADSLPLPSKRE